MAFTKAHLYNELDLKASYFAKAISHPARIGIIRYLCKNGSCTVEELMELHPLSQPSVSQHLGILRRANLIVYKEVHPYTYYNVNKENVKLLKKHLKSCVHTFKCSR